jgi:hypothetical protein
MNLHLYIPGLSAHLECCLKGAIFGNVIWYWNQNTSVKDFTNLMSEFAKHLKNRGHEMTEIEKMMLEAAKRIDSGEKSNGKNVRRYRRRTTQRRYMCTSNITHVTFPKPRSERLMKRSS